MMWMRINNYISPDLFPTGLRARYQLDDYVMTNSKHSYLNQWAYQSKPFLMSQVDFAK